MQKQMCKGLFLFLVCFSISAYRCVIFNRFEFSIKGQVFRQGGSLDNRHISETAEQIVI